MIPGLLVKIALIIIMVRCIFVTIELLGHSHKKWLDILFYLSIVIVALSYYLEHFHTFLGIFP